MKEWTKPLLVRRKTNGKERFMINKYNDEGITSLLTCILGLPLTEDEKSRIKNPDKFRKFLDVDESILYGYGLVDNIENMGKIERIPC